MEPSWFSRKIHILKHLPQLPKNAKENNTFKNRLIQMAKEAQKANEEENALKIRIVRGQNQDGGVERHIYCSASPTAHKIPVKNDSQQILEQQKPQNSTPKRFPTKGNLEG